MFPAVIVPVTLTVALPPPAYSLSLRPETATVELRNIQEAIRDRILLFLQVQEPGLPQMKKPQRPVDRDSIRTSWILILIDGETYLENQDFLL